MSSTSMPLQFLFYLFVNVFISWFSKTNLFSWICLSTCHSSDIVFILQLRTREVAQLCHLSNIRIKQNLVNGSAGGNERPPNRHQGEPSNKTMSVIWTKGMGSVRFTYPQTHYAWMYTSPTLNPYIGCII